MIKITSVITEENHEALKELSREEGRTMSYFLNRAITNFLKLKKRPANDKN